MKVLSVTSGRADIGILAPVWQALAASGADLHILMTGAHVANDAGEPTPLPAGTTVHRGGADLGGRGGAETAEAMARILDAAGRLADRLKPDRTLVVGDRIDMIPATLAFVPLNLPIVHLHGGELTLGAVDDRARHAITKLAHVHCVSNVDAAERVAQMGEEAWRIQITGAPGLDTLAAAVRMTAPEFARELGFETAAGLRLVTVHPETNSPEPMAPLDAVLAALDNTPGPALFTAPNADPGGKTIRQRIEHFISTRSWARFRDTLGGVLYANALQHASTMVGNSSSGLIEAGLFGLPVINVGRRQEGRLRGLNVRDCSADAAVVEKLLRTVPARLAAILPYGDGHAAPRVAAAVLAPHDADRLLFKRFENERVVFTAPWDTKSERRAG